MNHAPWLDEETFASFSFPIGGAWSGKENVYGLFRLSWRMQKNDSLNAERSSPASFLCRFQPGFGFDHLQQLLLPAGFRVDVTQVGRAVVAAFELIA